MWLWSSPARPGEVTVLWQAYLRRFDIEHTFRFFKQVLGWARPKLRDPAAADRWTWLVIAYTQLWLARPASAPKPGKPGPGRPPGSRNRHPATRHDVGKTVKRAETLKDPRKQTGLNNKGMSSSRIAQAVAPLLLLAQHRLRLDLDPDLAGQAQERHDGQPPRRGRLTLPAAGDPARMPPQGSGPNPLTSNFSETSQGHATFATGGCGAMSP